MLQHNQIGDLKMDTNTTNNAATFGQLVKDLPAGTSLVKKLSDGSGSEALGIWTGESLYSNGSQFGLVYSQTAKQIQRVAWDTETEWTVERSLDGTPGAVGPETLTLVRQIATLFSEKVGASARYERAYNDLYSFKSNAQAALTDWAESHIDEDSSEWTEFSEMLEEIGLEGLKKTYRVTVRVTYETEVEVEATSEDAARDEVDNNLSDYIYDTIDIGYYDDYSIESVERD